MSQPTRSDVHVNRPLTNISVSFIQKAEDFIADRVFPRVPSSAQSDRFFQYDKKQWYRSNARLRGPSTESAGGGFDIDNTPNFFCGVRAVHKDVSDQIRANQDSPLNMDRDATKWVTQQGLLRKEIDWAANFFKTGIWTGSTTGGDITIGTKWDDAGSDPVDDIKEQLVAAKERTGFKPNKMVVTPQVDRALDSNASVLDRIKHTQIGSVTRDMLARLFGVDEYMVAEATNDKAAEGLAEDMEYIFGTDQVALYYAAPAAGIHMPTAGYTFTWTGLFGVGAQGMRIKRFRMEHLESDRIEGEMAYDQKQIAADMGVFFDDVLL